MLNDIGKLCRLGFGVLVGVRCFYLTVWELSLVGGIYIYIKCVCGGGGRGERDLDGGLVDFPWWIVGFFRFT